MSVDLSARIWSTLGVEIAPHIEHKFDYKQFAGLASFTERVYCWEFVKGGNGGPTTPKVGNISWMLSFANNYVSATVKGGWQ